MRNAAGWSRRLRTLAWTAVFAANLLVPLPLGLEETRGGGQVGMGAAIFACWLIGLLICCQSSRAGPILIRGAAWVAATQFLPLLQIAAGILGLLCWERIAVHTSFAEGGPRAELSGFVVTMLTAAPLLLAATVFGGGFRLLFGPPEPDGDAAADYGEPAAPDKDREVGKIDSWPFG